MQELLVYQSLWAMERRRPDGQEYALDEKLNMIHEAGFDGVGIHEFFEGKPTEIERIVAFLKDHDMSWFVYCSPKTTEEFADQIAQIEAVGANHINCLPWIMPYTLEESVAALQAFRSLAEKSALPVHFETHRDRLMTDLHFTLHLLDCFPDIKLTGDLSHFVVGREFAWPISEHNHALMHRVIDHCWGFHGRVASREQIQVQISFPHHKDWLDLFLGWWEHGFRGWRKRAPADATLTFTCELGPKEYAMTGADGYELSDRWQEALTMKDLVRERWKRIESKGKAAAE